MGAKVHVKTLLSTNPMRSLGIRSSDSDRHIGMSPDGKTAIVIGGAQGIIAYDADTCVERWREEGTATKDRPRGKTHLEVAFAPDSSSVLLAPMVADGNMTINHEAPNMAGMRAVIVMETQAKTGYGNG